MAAMSGSTREQRPRQAILGQLPRISRDDGSPIRVLLVDDEPALTNLVKMALHYEGWTVEVACNGREAVGKFDDFGPDVLVLDIMLPDIDGLEILHRVRASGPYTPTLFLTARDSVMDRVTGLTAGADDYMTKPFSLEELVARLRGLLRRFGYGDCCAVSPISHRRRRRPSRSAIWSSTAPATKSTGRAHRYRCPQPSSSCCGS